MNSNQASEVRNELEVGTVIRVPQYANELEVTHLGELNGDEKAFIGVEFANGRSGASKHMIVNQHSGRVYLIAGTQDKGEVQTIDIVSQPGADGEDEDGELSADELVDIVADLERDELDGRAMHDIAKRHNMGAGALKGMLAFGLYGDEPEHQLDAVREYLAETGQGDLLDRLADELADGVGAELGVVFRDETGREERLSARLNAVEQGDRPSISLRGIGGETGNVPLEISRDDEAVALFQTSVGMPERLGEVLNVTVDGPPSDDPAYSNAF